jgi:uncharacterized protein
MLTRDDRDGLLRFARATIAAHLGGGPPPPPARLSEPDAHSGAFVTLHVRGELRGCIGYPGAPQRLDEVIGHCAVASATEDPRFPPLRADELQALRIEISVLTPIVRVEDLSQIDVGRDGLVVEAGLRRGLLLPQVATEHHWDRDTFLSQTCVKAGLSAHAWRTGAKVYRFQAEVFSEPE